MSFYYEPMTDEEIEKERAFVLLDKGIYPFEVQSAKYRESSNCNPMIELVLKVWAKDGTEHTIFDYLVSTKGMGWKTKHFCKATGLLHQYEEKTFNEFSCQGKSGHVEVDRQEARPKPGGGNYLAKNVIVDYIVKEENNTQPILNGAVKEPFADDLPF